VFHGGPSTKANAATTVANLKPKEQQMSIKVISVEEVNRLYPPRQARKPKTAKKPAKA